MTWKGAAVGFLVMTCVVGCRPVPITDAGYSVACSDNRDCALVPLEDVCLQCGRTPVARSDISRALEDIEDARRECLFGVRPCDLGYEAACLEGECVAVPLGDARRTDHRDAGVDEDSGVDAGGDAGTD